MTDQHVTHQQTDQLQESDDANRVTRDDTGKFTRLPWLARTVAIGLSGVSLGFVLLFSFIVGMGGNLTLITRPLAMQIALTLPYLVVLFTLVTTVGAALAWRNGYWSLSARAHQTLLALLGLVFSWLLSNLGFLTV
jgi:hypothetical protein